MIRYSLVYFFFFFNDTATTEIYTLSLHDALPIFLREGLGLYPHTVELHVGMGYARLAREEYEGARHAFEDRKSTRLNSSHSQISYAVFCLKKKKRYNTNCTYYVYSCVSTSVV